MKLPIGQAGSCLRGTPAKANGFGPSTDTPFAGSYRSDRGDELGRASTLREVTSSADLKRARDP